MENIAQKYFKEYSHVFKDDGTFPNSPLPVLIYKNVLDLPFFFEAAYIIRLFEKNHWKNAWKGGIFPYHHYHSFCHEAIGVYKGRTTLLLGGEKGMSIDLEKGDVIVIPAGVAHKNMSAEHDVNCVAAYPPGGHKYDICTGKPGERPLADTNISLVPLPDRDPVMGLKGGTEKYWKS